MMARFACVHVPFFAAAAAARCEPALGDRPLAIVRGIPPATRVLEASATARERGVAPGMTETEARARCPGLVSRPWCKERIASARHALLEAALAVSPRIEDAAAGVVFADLAGLERLFGDDVAVAGRLARSARRVGLPARVAVAGTRTAARIAARNATATVTAVPPDGERAALAGIPLDVLDLAADVATAFARWGVVTLGELAALPRAALAERLGAAALRAHDEAQGRDLEPFRPWTPPAFWEEAQGLDWEIDDAGALLAVLGLVLERLAARLEAAHVHADVLDLDLELTSGGRDQRSVPLAHPTREVALLRMLLRHELALRPPPAAVTAVAVSVRAVRGQPGQAGLWQPPAPLGRDLATLVTRLTALVGGDRVGSPSLVDSHRPDAAAVVPFAPPPEAPADEPAPALASLVLRRLRPPRPVDVGTDDERPVRVRRGDLGGAVIACAGPWRTSGEWWDARGWSREDWDVLLDDGTLCRIARDRVTGAWVMDGIYD